MQITEKEVVNGGSRANMNRFAHDVVGNSLDTNKIPPRRAYKQAAAMEHTVVRRSGKGKLVFKEVVYHKGPELNLSMLEEENSGEHLNDPPRNEEGTLDVRDRGGTRVEQSEGVLSPGDS